MGWDGERNYLEDHHDLRTFQQTPKGAYPKPPGPTVYVSEFLQFGGERGCLGYAKQGYVGVPLEISLGQIEASSRDLGPQMVVKSKGIPRKFQGNPCW